MQIQPTAFAILIGFALLSSAILLKKNDFESCFSELAQHRLENSEERMWAHFTARICSGIEPNN
ncbi:hypothetical protein QWE_07626 [Agrobacterium albertimagni AOL15]|uniref:Uncharacterized protein n=1 Tax=Agrobacterium albertimagni AOL15 TaxID=1156935 RepID=K2Q448_9HYPH|nr:hypothetical protein [Agrobacterium albertimagni]EKF59950.1 hypothetical protein QWE_07626 [Agrobacterium albertimagni AOL15]